MKSRNKIRETWGWKWKHKKWNIKNRLSLVIFIFESIYILISNASIYYPEFRTTSTSFSFWLFIETNELNQGWSKFHRSQSKFCWSHSKFNWSGSKTIWINRRLLKPLEDLPFYWTLIDFDWFDRSLRLVFDWVGLNFLIGFNWVRFFRLKIEFDWLPLTSPG